MASFWPGTTWADADLDPVVVPPNIPVVNQLIFPSMLVDTSIVVLCRESDTHTFTTINDAINCGINLRPKVNYRCDIWLQNCKNIQHRHLMRDLKAQGYVAQRGDPEIIAEIDRLGEQHPGSQIWVIAGSGITNYYNGIRHTGGPRLPEGAHIIRVANHGGYLDTFETAIFSEKQIKTSQSFTYAYGIERVPRQWNIQAAVHMKFGIEVTPRSDGTRTTRRINPPRRTSDPSFRFANLG
jgi:hypothetical protein